MRRSTADPAPIGRQGRRPNWADGPAVPRGSGQAKEYTDECKLFGDEREKVGSITEKYEKFGAGASEEDQQMKKTVFDLAIAAKVAALKRFETQEGQIDVKQKLEYCARNLSDAETRLGQELTLGDHATGYIVRGVRVGPRIADGLLLDAQKFETVEEKIKYKNDVIQRMSDSFEAKAYKRAHTSMLAQLGTFNAGNKEAVSQMRDIFEDLDKFENLVDSVKDARAGGRFEEAADEIKAVYNSLRSNVAVPRQWEKKDPPPTGIRAKRNEPGLSLAVDDSAEGMKNLLETVSEDIDTPAAVELFRKERERRKSSGEVSAAAGSPKRRKMSGGASAGSPVEC